MELKVVNDDEKKLVVELLGETVSFAHMLKDELCKDSSVKETAAIQEHPYLSQPKIFVAVSRGTPKAALEKASDNIGKQAKEFKDKFKDSMKK
jgi:DNA-directed RNA polymerase subunit L